MENSTNLVLLDTSVWIDALRGKTLDIVENTRKLLKEDRVATCGPVKFEIRRGLRNQERKGVLELFDALVCLSIQEALWEAAGDLAASLRGKGVNIPPMDVLIAQICLHNDVTLFTLDEHFRLIPGLKLFEKAGPALRV
ncbi:MAG: PIN domain-containing protein [Deltaproteobacteria bacterium]|nr:PIN domain-containing protein [Deltaproteobacteria bacterium]